MSLTTRLGAFAASFALLAGGFVTQPAHADDVVAAPAGTSITLQYAGDAKTVTLTQAATVAEAIAELNLNVDSNDRVFPARETAITAGMTLTVDVVSTKKKTKRVTIKKKTVVKKTKSLYKGQKKTVRKGRNGSAVRYYVVTTVNGKTTTTLVKTKVTKKKVNRIVKVGTKSKRGLNLARAKMWGRIAKCESGGRWHINTGNGYYGGLQFNLATWRSVKGYQFAKYPHQASKAEQITVANRLYAKRGLQPWGCRHAA